MKKSVFLLLLFAGCLLGSLTKAQTVYKFGYLSYSDMLTAMPEYAAAAQSLQELKAKYDAETKHNETSFNRMFADFLQGQKDFPLNILLKRQKELQEAMEKGIQFREETARLLSQAEADLKAPAIAKLDGALQAVGTERGYDFILNTDNKAVPFIHRERGEDITTLVKARLAAHKE